MTKLLSSASALDAAFPSNSRTKLTYGEQLKHPNWQKLRLQILSAADFQCEICGDTETTLHVHHKQYIKGRMAWEYEPSNFDALCEGCHASAHEAKDSINNALAAIPSALWSDASGLLIGWADKYDEDGLLKSDSPYEEAVGRLAAVASRVLMFHEIDSLREALETWVKTEASLNIQFDKRKPRIASEIG